MARIESKPFDVQQRLAFATEALHAAAERAKEASSDDKVPPDLAPPTLPPDPSPGGWRWRILDELTGLSEAVNQDHARALTRQARQAWQSRFGGPFATGAGAAVGSIVAAVGAGVVKTNTVGGWIVVILGILFAIGGSIISSNNYVQNRNKQLRFERLLFDIWDYAELVLPTATADATFSQLDTFRLLWETAGA